VTEKKQDYRLKVDCNLRLVDKTEEVDDTDVNTNRLSGENSAQCFRW